MSAMKKSPSYDSIINKLKTKFKKRSPSVPVKSDETLFDSNDIQPPAYSRIEEEPIKPRRKSKLKFNSNSNMNININRKVVEEKVYTEKQLLMMQLNSKQSNLNNYKHTSINTQYPVPFKQTDQSECVFSSSSTSSDSDSNSNSDDESQYLLKDIRPPTLPPRPIQNLQHPPQINLKQPTSIYSNPLTKKRTYISDPKLLALQTQIDETSESAHQVIVKIVGREHQISELQHRAGNSTPNRNKSFSPSFKYCDFFF